MKTIFVPNDEWNAHYESPEECAAGLIDCGDIAEGDEFSLVRLEVGANTTYRIVNGKPQPVALAFPAGIASADEDGVKTSVEGRAE